jgi:carbon storage regulator
VQNQGAYRCTNKGRLGESIIIGDNIKITIEKISKSQIKIGIEAPKEVVVCREEVKKKAVDKT